MPTSITAIANRLSKNQIGFLRTVLDHTAPGVQRRRDRGGWHFGRFHQRTESSLFRLGLIAANPDRAVSESAQRLVVVGHRRKAEFVGLEGFDSAWLEPIMEMRWVTVYRHPVTGVEYDHGSLAPDTEEYVLTDLGREVLELLAAA